MISKTTQYTGAVISNQTKHSTNADSSPVVFMQEIQRRERWVLLFHLAAAVSYMTTTGN